MEFALIQTQHRSTESAGLYNCTLSDSRVPSSGDSSCSGVHIIRSLLLSYVHTYTHTHTHSHIHTHTHTHTHIRHSHIRTHIWQLTHAHTRTHTHIRHSHIHTHIWQLTHTHPHTHTYTHRRTSLQIFWRPQSSSGLST